MLIIFVMTSVVTFVVASVELVIAIVVTPVVEVIVMVIVIAILYSAMSVSTGSVIMSAKSLKVSPVQLILSALPDKTQQI